MRDGPPLIVAPLLRWIVEYGKAIVTSLVVTAAGAITLDLGLTPLWDRLQAVRVLAERHRVGAARLVLAPLPDAFRPQPAEPRLTPSSRTTFKRFHAARRRVGACQARAHAEQLRNRFPKAAALLEKAAEELLALTASPKEHWRQIWANNPQERLNREIRRRTG